MTRYSVVWVKGALDELAELWLNAADRNAVTAAANAIVESWGKTDPSRGAN